MTLSISDSNDFSTIIIMKIHDFSARLAVSALLLIFAVTGTVAQNGTMTPYSRYGYGILRDRSTSTQRSMGGVGYAMQSGRQINAMNPASYAAIDSLTFLFDLGLDLTCLWQTETTERARSWRTIISAAVWTT